MTDEEIRCAVLKYCYNEKKAGKDTAMAVLSRMCNDYKLEPERVQPIIRQLTEDGFIENHISGKLVSSTDKVITGKGIKECEAKCSKNNNK